MWRSAGQENLGRGNANAMYHIAAAISLTSERQASPAHAATTPSRTKAASIAAVTSMGTFRQQDGSIGHLARGNPQRKNTERTNRQKHRVRAAQKNSSRYSAHENVQRIPYHFYERVDRRSPSQPEVHSGTVSGSRERIALDRLHGVQAVELRPKQKMRHWRTKS